MRECHRSGMTPCERDLPVKKTNSMLSTKNLEFNQKTKNSLHKQTGVVDWINIPRCSLPPAICFYIPVPLLPLPECPGSMDSCLIGSGLGLWRGFSVRWLRMRCLPGLSRSFSDGRAVRPGGSWAVPLQRGNSGGPQAPLFPQLGHWDRSTGRLQSAEVPQASREVSEKWLFIF